MNRREALKAGVTSFGGLVVAGCLDAFETESVWRDTPLVENRPDAVYLPAGIEEMATYGMAESGDYRLALLYTFPHRFWTVTGTQTNRVEVAQDDTLHLMMTAWDGETGTVLPIEPQVDLRYDGNVVASRSLWPMLSQRMGFHYGDNLTLDEEGTYTAEVRAPVVDARLTGELSGRFDDVATAEIEFEYDVDDIYDLEFDLFDEDDRGKQKAVPLMRGDRDDHDDGGHDHRVPVSAVPPVDELPGTLLGTDTSGDALFAVTVVEDGARFDVDGSYLLVSPRTPYNGVPLPQMSATATVDRDGSTMLDDGLTATVDPEVGLHYGTAVDSIDSGDSVTVTIDAPPQVARHDGYETAFFDMPQVEISAPE